MAYCENLTIRSDPAELAKVRTAIETCGDRIGFGRKDCHAMALAVDEALTNVIRHAYKGASDKKIDVRIERVNEALGRQGLKVCIRDFGEAVEICKIKGRDLEDVRPGGLGVHIMRRVMDEVIFECHPDGGTLLRMVKYLKSDPAKE